MKAVAILSSPINCPGGLNTSERLHPLVPNRSNCSMKAITDLITAASPVLLALIGLIVIVMQGWMAWKLKQIQHQGNAAHDAIVSLTKSKSHAEGRLEEADAAQKGTTSVGDPIK